VNCLRRAIAETSGSAFAGAASVVNMHRTPSRPSHYLGKIQVSHDRWHRGVYVASLTLPCVRTFGHIGASHVAAVLGLTEDDREPMLARAESGRMSVRELRQAIVQARRADGERRGRPLLGTPARALALLRTAVQAAREALGYLQQEPGLGFQLKTELRKEFTDLGGILSEAVDLTREKPGVVPARSSMTWRQRSA